MIHLTGHNYNSREIIQNIFSPLIGVITSPLADEICHRNNLSFVELLQPFAKIPNDAHFRDVSGTSVSVRGLRLNFCDVDWRPPQTVLARKMLNEAVTNAHNDKTRTLTLGGVDLELPTKEPWFEHWRETFLTVQFPADHEFTRHFLSCIIVLSSADPNIMETAHKLTQRVHQMQNVTPQKLPKWFHPAKVVNSYVLLHEGSQGTIGQVQQIFELLDSTYREEMCFLLQVNSSDGNATSEIQDYWATFIRRQLKSDAQSDQQMSGPKTPQDGVSVISMPSMQMSSLLEQAMTTSATGPTSAASSENDLPILHPLSPVQENAAEAINSKFSISSESLVSQTAINPNVWPTELDMDAPHGGCLNASDIENVKNFVQSYAVRVLIPYVEQLVVQLNEGITNKKGVSKSLLSATKRWFVTSKPAAGASNQNAVIYTHESAELQTRKLGDLYFMFGHYNLAFQAYHQAKRDFNADSAWQYYAGALEMAAISAFMLGTANRKTYDYMEDAIVCYLTVCKLQQFATRATLLSMECLKTARLYGETAKQLIRMTSEESDLRSALLLEQASYFYLLTQPPMHRKYAFHIVLSGNRYSRSGQRKHAYRCYRQAYQIFQGRGWSLAEDHIQYTMAKQAYALKRLEEAGASFAHLLRAGSLQSAQQQANFLREYGQTQNELIKRHPELGLLSHALPQVIQDSIRVLVLAHPPAVNTSPYVPASGIDIKSDLRDESKWQKLEEMIVTTAASHKPFVFKCSRYLFTKENATVDLPITVQGETLELAVKIVNPIRFSLTLANIDLLWRLNLDNGECLSNECLYDNANGSISKSAAVTAAIKTICNQTIVLEERAEKQLHFKVTPKLTGRLNIVGVMCSVVATNEPTTSYLMGLLRFEAQRFKAPPSVTGSSGGGSTGKLSSTQLLQSQSSAASLFDNKLNVKVVPAVPSLSVSFTAVPTDVVAGEIVPVTMSLRNCGIAPIDDIYLACDSPRWISLLDKRAAVPLTILSHITDLSNEKLSKDREIRRQHVHRLSNGESGLPITLKAQETVNLPMWIQAPYTKGDFTPRLLFYYGLPSVAGVGGAAAELKYRLVRHHWSFVVHECLLSETSCVVSNNLSGELGLDVSIRNMNAMHNPLMIELYINRLSLFCAEYKLNAKKLYVTNRMEIIKGHLGDHSLKSSKSASFQCRLVKTPPNAAAPPSTAAELLKQRLSTLSIWPDQGTPPSESALPPPLQELYGFLARHESVFFSSAMSNEEFNNAVAGACSDSHATVALHWSAVVVQNSVQRIAYGQNFMRLSSLYELGRCPPSATARPMRYPVMGDVGGGDGRRQAALTIYDYARSEAGDKLRSRDVAGAQDDSTDESVEASFSTEDTDESKNDVGDDDDDDEDYDDDDDYDVDDEDDYRVYRIDDDFWEPNDEFVSKRCLLEDESLAATATSTIAAMASVKP